MGPFQDWNGKTPPTWWPLKEILTCFLEMIHQQPVVAVSEDPDYDNIEEPRDYYWEEPIPFFTPWILPDDDHHIVEFTLSAWQNLLPAIEARIPQTTKTIKHET